jgi:hypothetical protein
MSQVTAAETFLAAIAELDPEEALEALRIVRRALVKPKRGGDPYAEQRRKRDDNIRALVPLVAPGKSLEQQARDIAGRLTRYRPMPEETSPERRLMREIVEVGLPIGADRIRKILGKQ